MKQQQRQSVVEEQRSLSSLQSQRGGVQRARMSIEGCTSISLKSNLCDEFSCNEYDCRHYISEH